MRVIFVDNESWSIEEFKNVSSTISDVNKLDCFTRPQDALKYVKSNDVDLAFLDIDMPGMNGIDLGKEILKLNNKIIIIYISAYEEYMPRAFREKADYYVLKPYNKEDIEDAVRRAKLLLNENIKSEKRIKIHTFGAFELFVDNKPVCFGSKKAKELLALLVDYNGKIVDSKTAFNYMWEDKYYNNVNASLYRHVLIRLENVLKEYGISDLVIKYPRGRALNVDIVECDYFNFINNRDFSLFTGSYMSDYSWGEETLGSLTFLISNMERNMKN